METKYFLAVDIGASSGRHILGHLQDNRICLEEVHRFENKMTEDSDHLIWDVDRLFDEIITGMRKCKETGRIPVSVGVDTWGVDYALLDDHDRLCWPVFGYRDHRTEGMDEEVYKVIPEQELYERVGIQKAIYNTIFQLYADKLKTPERLAGAHSLLMVPDYFHFLLSGKKTCEYTEASTSALLDPVTKDWDRELIKRLELPVRIFQDISMPGTCLGGLTDEVAKKVGYNCDVVLPPSHDTASAVLAVPSDEENTCYISSGTWSLMGVELDKPDCTRKSCKAYLTNEGGYGGVITYLTNIMGLWMIQSVRNKLAPDMSYGTLCELASKETIKSVVDCQDTAFLAPDDMAEAVRDHCRKSGQTVPETLPELAAVIYNSLAKCYADKLALIESITGVHYDNINIIGGGSNADYLNELTAARTGRTVIAGPSEATALGNILTQMIRHGDFKDVSDARQCVRRSFTVRTFDPQQIRSE
ncbi:MAG: rhamnulokinase [Lachnospiraceae bacterium]|nr:rhamnulokinase [Lachnospiraceae bacterium]